MTKTVIKGMLLGALVSLVWDAVGGVLTDYYKIATLPEDKATQVLERLQEFAPQPGEFYFVPSLGEIVEKITEDNDPPLVVLMLKPQLSFATYLLSILLSYFLAAAFLTLALCLATRHSLPLRRQHVVIGAVLGILIATSGLGYVIGFGFPLKFVGVEILNEGIHYTLMALAIHPFARRHY